MKHIPSKGHGGIAWQLFRCLLQTAFACRVYNDSLFVHFLMFIGQENGQFVAMP